MSIQIKQFGMMHGNGFLMLCFQRFLKVERLLEFESDTNLHGGARSFGSAEHVAD